MGLDQYLYARKYYSKYCKGRDKTDFAKLLAMSKAKKYLVPESVGHQSAYLVVKVGQWRKAHQIHQWVVDNCQDSVDDCRETYVQREDLEELLALCESVANDHSKAREELPFGWSSVTEDYSQHYYDDIDYTINLIKHVLTMPDEWEFYYSSSW